MTDKYKDWIVRYYASHDDIPEGLSDGHIVRELIKCNDCKHKTKCYSDVVMIDKSRTADIYESVEWCSLGERETE